jgi:hypothetical protein
MILIGGLLKTIINFLLGKKSEPKTVQTTVYETVKSFGKKGCISDEILKKNSSIRYSSITARYKELLEKNLIELTGEYRPGSSGKSQRVMRARG